MIDDDVYFQKLLAARAHLPLPTESDFCGPGVGGPPPDAGRAWLNFGGLSLDAACQKFTECPEIYQEDFMWMFPRAFEYYYPVADRYLRTARVKGGDDYCPAWILGCDLKSQFHWADGSRPPDYVVAEIRDLAEFVRHHVSRFSTNQDEQEQIDACWAKLQKTLSGII